MACSCNKDRTKTADSGINPMTQCIVCAQKHLDEAWECFHEYKYTDANRRHIRGSLRAVVSHTYKDWPNVADLARSVALLIQEAKDQEAELKMEELCTLVDSLFLEANPEVASRLDALAREHRSS